MQVVRVSPSPQLFLGSTLKAKSQSSSQYSAWSGLQSWRDNPINEDRRWGPTSPEPISDLTPTPIPTTKSHSLAELGAEILSTPDPLAKSQLSHFAYATWRRHSLPIGVAKPPSLPARPSKPQLVSAKEIPGPKESGLPLNAYMLHNLAHVELNAIDLAWDTAVRFSPFSDLLGDAFFADFARVADDESRHFSWCSQRLAELGYKYGDMPAHNLLWTQCEKTSDSVAARLAAIPLVQEARGLDAGPRLVQRLVGFGDLRTSKIVARIAEEEVAHVAVGLYWFVDVCNKMRRDPDSSFKALLKEYNVEVKGPFNYLARDIVGIPRHWYDASSANKHDKNEQLSEVYERLSSIVSMESENAALNRPSEQLFSH